MGGTWGCLDYPTPSRVGFAESTRLGKLAGGGRGMDNLYGRVVSRSERI
jgi:hypothetical protein